jgi:hypothetical protein
MHHPLTLRSVPAQHATHLVLRWVLGLTFVATALGKALDIPGFHDVLNTYDLFPAWSLWPIAVTMPLIEALIAASMLTGRRLILGVAASFLVNGGFAVVLSLELLRGVHLSNCGCFGVFLARPLRWSSPLEDIALVAVTIGILVTRLPHSTEPASARRP